MTETTTNGHDTAISFGLALRLKQDEFALFLQNAGYALSYSSIFDLVIRFVIPPGRDRPPSMSVKMRPFKKVA